MSTPTVIQSCAALYGIVPGAAGVTFVNGQIGTDKAFATEDAMLNHYYEATFTVWAPKTTAQVAGLIVANLGLTGDTATSEAARIAGLLDGVAMNVRGAKVKEIVTAFEATPAAATFNTAKAALVTAVADPTYQGIPGKGVGELVFASLSTAQIQLGTSEAINTVLLTTGVDTVPGSAGTELITGGITVLSTSNTLAATDQIDGGEGTDILNLSVSTDFGGFSGAGYLKNVETVNLTSSVTTSETFAAKQVSGVKTYTVSGLVDLSSIEATTVAVNLSNVSTASTLAVGFIDEAVTGSSTSATLGLSKLGSQTSAGVPTTVTLTTAGVETLNLVANGTSVVGIGSTTVKDISITGASDLRIASSNTGVKSVNASTATGIIDLDLQAATSVTSVKTGFGADAIRIDDLSLTPTAVIDGGSGADTLRIDATGTTLIVAPVMTGVETVRVGNVANNITFSGSSSTGIEKIYISRDADASLTSTFSGMGEVASLVIQADRSTDTAAAHTTSVENTGKASVSLEVSSAAVASTSAETTTDSVTLTKATSAELTVPSFGTWTSGTLTADKATSVTVGGAGTITALTVNADAATVLTVNQTTAANSMALTFDTDAATSTLTGLNVTAAGTVSFATQTDLLSKLQALNITNAKPLALNETLIANAATVSLTGTASTASATFGILGATDLAYGMTVSATGQTAGLTIDDVLVGTGQSITLNLGGVTGNTDIGDVKAGSATAGSVTISAAGHGAGSTAGTLTVAGTGEVIQAGTVTIDVTGAKGAVVLGTNGISGNSVTVLAGTAESTVAVGDITAKNSLTFQSPAAKATTEAFIVGASSTTFTAALTGSITGDSFTITSPNATQTSIVVTGDMKDGTDSLTVRSVSSTASGGQTIDISGLSNLTSSTLDGAANARNTIKGGSGADTILGGSKADVLTGGGGNDSFVIKSVGYTGQVAVSSLESSSKFASGKSVSTVDLDVIMDFGASDNLEISGFTAVNALTAARVVYGTTSSTVADAAVALLNGTYSTSANTFTTSSTGTDSLFVYGSGGNDYGVVLVGFTTGLTTTGATTGVIGTSS